MHQIQILEMLYKNVQGLSFPNKQMLINVIASTSQVTHISVKLRSEWSCIEINRTSIF